MKRATAGLWAALIGAALLAGCERPPMESSQRGYRGTGMAQVTNPRIAAATQAAQPLPADVPPVPSDPNGPLAKDAFKNVQVLGNQPVGEFTRTMLAITAWVSPEQGCNYCHAPGEDLSSDKLYTKVVARKMLAMNQSINGKWKAHVGETGVTCYTCHRGQPVPAQVWYDQPGGRSSGFTADAGGQNLASKQAAYSSMGVNVLADYLVKDGALRQASDTALPAGNPATIRQTEGTFGLMMHISQSLGVNCTFCHATQAHPAWGQSPMSRTTAYQGIRMARDLNNAHVLPLAGTLPPERLGPLGDVPKVNCATCHQGVSKPLNGAQMAKGFPALLGGGMAKAAAGAGTAPAVSAGAGGTGAAAAAGSDANAGASPPTGAAVSTSGVTSVALTPSTPAAPAPTSAATAPTSAATAPTSAATSPTSAAAAPTSAATAPTSTPSPSPAAASTSSPSVATAAPAAAAAEVDVAPDALVGAGYPEMVSFFFDTAKAALAADARSQLQSVIAYATTHNDARIGISGYHDRHGSAAANIELAKARAKATRELLVAAGVPAERIVMVKPRETVGGSDDRAARRVDVYPAR